MEITNTQKYLKMSPTKLRFVVAMIKKLKPARAVEVLPFVARNAAEPLAKTIKGAIAIAKAKGFSEDEISFKEIQINEGPRLKRGIPVSRGRWHPIVKKMAHIRVTLNANKVKAEAKGEIKEIKKDEVKNEEVKIMKEVEMKPKKAVKNTAKKGTK